MARPRWSSLIAAASLTVLAFLAYSFSADLLALAGIDPAGRIHLPLRQLSGVVGWLALAWFGARLVDLLAGTSAAPLPRFLQDMARVVLFSAAALAILAYVFDQPVTGLLATSGVLVAVLGFALRNLIADLFSGIALNVEHPYRIGDWIELSPGVIGRVAEINWRATRLATRDATSIVVPNSLVAGSRFINYSYPERRYRASLRFTLDANIPVERARRVLLAGALSAPGILAQPRPEALVEGANERGVIYVVQYWVPDFHDDNPCRDAVVTSVLRSLHRAGIDLAWPKRDVVLARGRSRGLQRRPHGADLLAQVDLFDAFDEAETAALADGMAERLYREGAIIVRQGEPGASLFLIAEGVLDVSVATEGRTEPVRLDRMVPGEVFGEMSLLTGQPRTASVVAATDAVVYEIHRDHLDPILHRRPEIAARLADLMAQRQRRNRERFQVALGSPEASSLPVSSAHDILSRLRGFFGLA